MADDQTAEGQTSSAGENASEPLQHPLVLPNRSRGKRLAFVIGGLAIATLIAYLVIHQKAPPVPAAAVEKPAAAPEAAASPPGFEIPPGFKAPPASRIAGPAQR